MEWLKESWSLQECNALSDITIVYIFEHLIHRILWVKYIFSVDIPHYYFIFSACECLGCRLSADQIHGLGVPLPDSPDQSESVGTVVAPFGYRIFFSIHDHPMVFVRECNDPNLNLNLILRFLIPIHYPLHYTHIQAYRTWQ